MNVVDINSTDYPARLKEIKDPPRKLYFKGEWNGEIFEKCLGVVGARKMTTYGKTVITRFVPVFCSSGLTIISGFMYGVDATAHESAVDVRGKTIAVMPCGIELIHPEYQEKLYNTILETGGLIVSEYPDSNPPALWTYPRRNRIIAGLSEAVLVIEAGIKSGALITANIARRNKKKLFAVPGPVTSESSKGTNILIKNGAALVSGYQDVLDYFNISAPDPPNDGENKNNPDVNSTISDPVEKSIFNELNYEPKAIDQLSRILNLPSSRVGAALSVLCLKNIITEKNGKFMNKESPLCL